jgi:hypothetical protein
MKTNSIFKTLILGIALSLTTSHAFSQIFVNSLDPIPDGWKGPVFQLSKNFPKTKPTEKSKPWLKYDFKTQPKEYMDAVLKYFLEGNLEANWDVSKNKVRKWYNAPSMAWAPSGREFIHGLTRERNSSPYELYDLQKDVCQNWAVGFYNAPGGYTFGQVWSDTLNLKLDLGIFPEGTVAGKLLFTAADPAQVPYVNGSLEWQANISDSIRLGSPRSPKTVRLLQLDIAIRDMRSDGYTGWVFGTFAYNANAKGKTVWEKMVPVGLMWGNDPDALNAGDVLKETWINPEFTKLFTFPSGKVMHVGYQGRLNGPVDNPASSCMSCHATAQHQKYSGGMIPKKGDPESIKWFFRNVKAGVPFDGTDTSISLDYSLQMSGGVAAAIEHRPKDNDPTTPEANPMSFMTSMDVETPPIVDNEKDKKEEVKPKEDSKMLYWALGGLVALLLIIFLYRKMNGNKK